MNKYFILLSFIFAVSNSGAASVLEKAKQKLEETKESVAQPQVAQLQAAQPQAAPPSDANSYCNAIINSTEMKIYTDKYELILNRRSALTRMGVNTSFMQRFLSDSFMRGADDNLRSRSDALVKRIHEAIPSQGESSEDLNKEAIIEKYIAWYALCAAKLKDSSLKYIFLDPSLPPDTINKFYNSSDQEKVDLLRRLWGGGPMVGTRLNDRVFKEMTGFQPKGINPYWVTPMLFAVSKRDNLTPTTSQQIALFDRVIADLDSRIATAQALQKEKADDKEKELARLEKEKQAEAKRLEDLAFQKNKADQALQWQKADDYAKELARLEKERQAKAKQLEDLAFQQKKTDQDLPALFRLRYCKSADVSLSAPLQFNYRKHRTGDICEWSDDLIRYVAGQALNNDKVDLVNTKVGYVFTKTMGSVGDDKFSYLMGYLDEFTNKFYIGSFQVILCKASADNSLNAGNSFRISLDAKYGKSSRVISEYDKVMDQVKATEAEIAVMRKKAITVKDSKDIRDYESFLNILRNTANSIPKELISVVVYEYNPNDSAWNKAYFPYGTVTVGQSALTYDEKKFASCKEEDAFRLGFTATKAMFENIEKLEKQRGAIVNERQKKAPSPKLD